jgi:O-acetyl-ADP-ribose deacetylase (regulator of RNase III)
MEQQSASMRLLNQHSIEILRSDLTEQKVDGIVNAANSQLMHGSGVAAAIFRKGRQIIQTESEE